MKEETRLKIAGIIHDLGEELELNKGLKYRNGYREALDNVYSEINKLTIPVVVVVSFYCVNKEVGYKDSVCLDQCITCGIRKEAQ